MDTNLAATLTSFVDIFKAIWFEALIIYALIGLAKLAGIITKKEVAQFANAFGAFVASGGKMLGSTEELMTLGMYMVVASFYYHVWKLLKPQLQMLVAKVSEKLG